MVAITINDLPTNRDLDRKAMSFIKGGAFPWMCGPFAPYRLDTPAFGQVVNFYQVNNSYYADQMINQYQTIDVNNSGANSNLNLVSVVNASQVK
jgi:hypothetical protein